MSVCNLHLQVRVCLDGLHGDNLVHLCRSTVPYSGKNKFGDFSQNAMFLDLVDIKFGNSVHVYIPVDRGGF